VLIAHFQLSD